MGHDSAWRKAATVAIIAAMLPRSSRGLDDIASTANNVGRSMLLAENTIVTGRAQEEGYAVLPGSPLQRHTSPAKQASEDPDPYYFADTHPILVKPFPQDHFS
jgi:hypothetical protein